MTWVIDETDVKLMSPEMINLRGIKVDTTKQNTPFLSTYIFYSSINITANCINNYTTMQCLLSTCAYQVTSNASLKVEGINKTIFITKFK